LPYLNAFHRICLYSCTREQTLRINYYYYYVHKMALPYCATREAVARGESRDHLRRAKGRISKTHTISRYKGEFFSIKTYFIQKSSPARSAITRNVAPFFEFATGCVVLLQSPEIAYNQTRFAPKLYWEWSHLRNRLEERIVRPSEFAKVFLYKYEMSRNFPLIHFIRIL